MADNAFSVKVPSIYDALLAGEQGYKETSSAVKEQQTAQVRDQVAQDFMKGGDPQTAIARLMGIGDTAGATMFSNMANQKSQRDIQQQQLGLQGQTLAETSRHNKASEATAAADKNGIKVIPYGGGIVDSRGNILREPGFPAGGAANDTSTEIAARQVIAGDMSGLKNRGRGAQGAQEINAIRNKAADILTSEYGMSPAEAATHISTKFQQFNAAGIGQNAEARTGATREANLNIILKATEAAIPAALEASAKVARTGWVPVNKIIQQGQVIASSPELKQFGMANLQLAEHWARAMNPTGVMRESDRDKALEFLSTADSPSTYAAAVNQLRTQITRERDAVKSGISHNPLPAPASGQPAPQQPVVAPAAQGQAPASTSTGVQWRIVQ